MLTALASLAASAAPAAEALHGVLGAPGPLDAAPLPGLAGPGGALWLLALPLVLAAAALALRQRPQGHRQMRIVETQGLGGRRALVLVQLDGESLLLASSESGISLLATRPARRDLQLAAGQGPALSLLPQPPPHQGLGGTWLGRALARFAPQQKAPAPPFAPVLEETLDDQELRRKLSAGRSGRVP